MIFAFFLTIFIGISVFCEAFLFFNPNQDGDGGQKAPLPVFPL